jgi:outer membrane protein OmpA-like peptidoglycan-associated protein
MSTNFSGDPMPIKSWSIVMLSLLIPLTSHATDIRQRPYKNSFDSALAIEDDQFVVCSGCPDNQLLKMSVNPNLALRMSTHLSSNLPVTREEQKEETLEAQDANKPIQLASILFGFDSVKVPRSDRVKLDRLMANLPRSGKYDLAGFTCSIGRDDYNEKLSLRRANVVADIFKANGLNVGLVEGKGKCCPVSEERQLNRRVEIIEHLKGEK